MKHTPIFAAIFCGLMIFSATSRGEELYLGSDVAHSVVLIDSQLAGSIPKGEIAGSQIKSYFFRKTKIDFPLG